MMAVSMKVTMIAMATNLASTYPSGIPPDIADNSPEAEINQITQSNQPTT